MRPMRIINQNGNANFPFDNIIVSINSGCKNEIIAYNTLILDKGYLCLAKYDNKEMAMAAMDMLRDDYADNAYEFQFPTNERMLKLMEYDNE